MSRLAGRQVNRQTDVIEVIRQAGSRQIGT